MSRYVETFKKLKADNRGAFIPFVTIGDPSLQQSYQIIKQLIVSGADALELGLPFSDPIADGPTIQAANIRALENNANVDGCFEVLKQIRDEFPDVPIGLLLYSNLIMARGLEAFYQLAKYSGVDSILVADVPVRESKPFRKAAEAAQIEPVFIVPPTVSKDSLKEIASYSRGYTYLLSRAGVTGAETKANMPSDVMIRKLKEMNAAPPVLGFGISSPEQVKNAISSGAEGAISGSAVVKIIEDNLHDDEKMLKDLGEFVAAMSSATR